jgi:DNA repair exonuclease SbcCD nuclease subunit
MRILHFSDTHLGFQAFDQVTTDGINAREQDVYDGFQYVIDQALDLKPDVIIHSGDFFHRPSPSNRALTFALEQLSRLCQANIPIVLIAGNHETPKTIYTSPILKAFRSLACVHPFFGDTWECFELGDLAIHGVPHINDTRKLNQELDRMEPQKDKFNVLLLHTSLGKRFLMEEYGEQVFPAAFEIKLKQFQYVALGHWHDYQSVDLHSHAWYSGSTERFSDTEHESTKGFILLDSSNGAHQFHDIPTRPWLKLELKKCHDLQVDEILQQLADFGIKNKTQGAIVSVNLLDIRLEQSLEISNKTIREYLPDCFHLIPRRKIWSKERIAGSMTDANFDKLDSLFYQYISEKYKDDESTAKALQDKAAYYFRSLE